ncbi:MAG: YqgE/AlgH family protein [Brumimicrobium sp.]|nr:YqgE/AlgH family protein [Brumimicrobium sp.]
MDLSFSNKRKARKGRVLIADPFTNDDYFGRAVVYLCDHNSEGTFGFVLNNFLDIDLSEIAKNFPDISTNVSIGGPVQTEHIFFLHTVGKQIQDSVEVDDGIYIGGNYDDLRQQLDDGKISSKDVRFFLGYSGWSPGQLQEEIDNHSWIVAPVISPGEIMDAEIKDIWSKYMRREGKKYDILSRSPIDFTAN